MVLMVVIFDLCLFLVIVKVFGVVRFMIDGRNCWCVCLVLRCMIVVLKRFYCMFDLICIEGLLMMSFLKLVMLLLWFFLLLSDFGKVCRMVFFLMRCLS